MERALVTLEGIVDMISWQTYKGIVSVSQCAGMISLTSDIFGISKNEVQEKVFNEIKEYIHNE